MSAAHCGKNMVYLDATHSRSHCLYLCLSVKPNKVYTIAWQSQDMLSAVLTFRVGHPLKCILLFN